MVFEEKWNRGKVFVFHIAFSVRNINACLNAGGEALE